MTADVILLDSYRPSATGKVVRAVGRPIPARHSLRLLRLALLAWWSRSWFAAELREQRTLLTWLVAILAVAFALGLISDLQHLAPISGAEVAR